MEKEKRTGKLGYSETGTVVHEETTSQGSRGKEVISLNRPG